MVISGLEARELLGALPLIKKQQHKFFGLEGYDWLGLGLVGRFDLFFGCLFATRGRRENTLFHGKSHLSTIQTA